MRLFIYGTLRHLALREAVLGAGHAVRLSEGTLHGYEVVWSPNGPYPLIRAEQDGIAKGLILEGLSADDMARLDYFEGAFDYTTEVLGVRSGAQEVAAKVYLPGEPDPGDAFEWDLEDWAEAQGDVAVEAAHEVMGYYGQMSPKEVGARFGQIRARASARVRARHEPVTALSGLTRKDVELNARRRPYSQFFTMQENDLRFAHFEGGQSAEVTRAIFEGGDAAILLPYDPVRDRILVIEQFRTGPYARGDGGPWSLEAIAGRVDPGETPEAAARREAVEEAGLELGGLEQIGASYPSPGSSSEFFYIFAGICDLPDSIAGVGGALSEAEDIRSHLIPALEAIEMLDGGEIRVLPLYAALQWLARNRERLMSQAARPR
jgi:nudix-type nucleoside diphosphatase (YffH/AdpP family)